MRPQPDAVKPGRQHNGQRGTPATGADDRDIHLLESKHVLFASADSGDVGLMPINDKDARD